MAGVRLVLMYLAQEFFAYLEKHRARSYRLAAFSAAEAFPAAFFQIFLDFMRGKIIIKSSFDLSFK